ncbi:FadR/GntR family transcriptional regulator [Asticcacaulis sp. AC460]|uniref:FadR/GntR family transcriptional regulator n=1 Tax=Asticcacaulis sp. AC460 TaxID=1282360 RepID=UPI002101B331|nr:FadR/GntR family transcriptional regulator [Asticcacaulis sp. AC460]
MDLRLENQGGFLPIQHGIAPTNGTAAPSSRLSDSIAQQLGMDIVCGLYAVGEALPTEVTLAAHWNVSRTAIREGLAILISKGLIEPRKKAGTIVTERGRWHLLDPLVLFWMRLSDPDERFIRSLFELRLTIEPQAAGLAARRRTDRDLIRLQKAFDIMSDDKRTEETARRAEIQFHRTIIEAANNPVLLPLAASIEAAVFWTNSYKSRRNIPVRASLEEHRMILDAVLREDDAQARWVTETLIRSTLEPIPANTRAA